MREALEHHTGESGEQKLLENMLQLFVIVLRADGAISAMEQQSVATLVRDTYGKPLSKLQQMLTVEDLLMESVCWAECVVWRGKGNVAARFVHRGVCGQRLCPG